ncbi:unnamed protein product [Oikopleura dioica]|uniref:Uncharacterized protein n=1 Tax=Oikopleura dioica TaxID=34765 RepID=E4WUR6_OIKDI|nr:unnamed protein product [Oikopleura dioica]
MSGKKESTSKGEGRVPTPMPTTPAVIQVKYSKTVKHLSLKELALICRQYGLNYKSGDTKSDLAKKIQKLMPSFLTNTVWKYYFIQEGKTLKIVGKPKDSADFTQREARTDHLLDCDQILQEISNLRILALDDEQMSISSDCDEEEGFKLNPSGAGNVVWNFIFTSVAGTKLSLVVYNRSGRLFNLSKQSENFGGRWRAVA